MYCTYIYGGVFTLLSEYLGGLAQWLRTRIVHPCSFRVRCTEGAGREAKLLLVLLADEWLIEVVVNLLSISRCGTLLLPIGLIHN